MAARTNTPKLNERWREKIRTSMLINRLQDNAVGKVDLTAIQQKSIEILLRKTAPDLGRIEHTGEGGGPVEVTAKWLSARSL